MKRTIEVTGEYLAVPVYTAHLDFPDLWYMKLTDETKDGAFLAHFLVPHRDHMETPDYYAYLPAGELWHHQISFDLETEEEGGRAILAGIRCEEKQQYPSQERPSYNFTAPCGWINDPNGCIFVNGQYHLYFQHNPMNDEWANMSWGHAVSDDGLHFTFQGDVMFPAKEGLRYSGCAIENERGLLGLPKDAILYFYTVSCDPTRLGEKVRTHQRLAYSLDGGKTLLQKEDWSFPYIGQDTRDPKVFWHEETNAYIMILYLGGWQFGIFRSTDLAHWEKTQVLEDEGMWECPDLFSLTGDIDGERITKWFFTSADGYYYAGSFDGYTFTKEGKRRNLYGTKLPYAAQTFAGTGERKIAVAWLRTEKLGKFYEGAMSRLRSYSLAKDGAGFYIRQLFLIDRGNKIGISQESGKEEAVSERISGDGALYFAVQNRHRS